jgi:hypothetical protein
MTVSQTNLMSRLRSSNSDVLSLTRRDVVCYSVNIAILGTYQRTNELIWFRGLLSVDRIFIKDFQFFFELLTTNDLTI